MADGDTAVAAAAEEEEDAAHLAVSKYDRLKNWLNVQGEILVLLDDPARENEDITIPSGLQVRISPYHQGYR